MKTALKKVHLREDRLCAREGKAHVDIRVHRNVIIFDIVTSDGEPIQAEATLTEFADIIATGQTRRIYKEAK